jgi:CheY-like chemotaxis protein
MKSILLVDDEANICVELQRRLQEFGYGVEVAHTFESALSCFGRPHFNVIVLEFNLKSEDPAQSRTGNGIRLIRQFRAVESSVPILMYTVIGGRVLPDNFPRCRRRRVHSEEQVIFQPSLAPPSTCPPARSAEARGKDSAIYEPIPRAHGWIERLTREH